MSYTPEVCIAGTTFKSVPTRVIVVTTPSPYPLRETTSTTWGWPASTSPRTLHSNISFNANRFILQPGGSLARGRSVTDLWFTSNQVEHSGPTVETATGSAVELFTFSASHRLRFAANRYASGFTVLPAISGISASEVDVCGDDVSVCAPDVTAAEDASFGVPVSPLAWLNYVPDGNHVFMPAASPNVLEARTLTAQGRLGQTYRRVIIAA